MKVVPVRYTDDVPGMRRFLEALGLHPGWASDAGTWLELTAAGGGLGLHATSTAEEPADAGSTVLSFESDEPLEPVAERLRRAGFDADIVDESFGRSLRTVDPDGIQIQVNEAMTDPYGYSHPER